MLLVSKIRGKEQSQETEVEKAEQVQKKARKGNEHKNELNDIENQKHLVERVQLYEGNMDALAKNLLSTASCDDLVQKLETTITKIQEHKVTKS